LEGTRRLSFPATIFKRPEDIWIIVGKF